MEDKLFNTPEKRQEAIILFTELLAHPGWILFTKICDANIENVKSLLTDSSEDHTKEQDDRWRDKLKVYMDLRNTPQSMIENFNRPSNGQSPELDPYSPSTVDKK